MCQVSEMRIDEPRVQCPKRVQNTPAGGLECISKTPDQIASMYTPDQPMPGGRFQLSSPEQNHKQSSMLPGQDNSRSSASCQVDHRVFNAPPLPSSPELSIGGKSRQSILPQFSPIATLRLQVHDVGVENTQEQTGGMMTSSPPSAAPQAPTETTSEMTTPATLAPPAMPWMDTPEQIGRKPFVPIHRLRYEMDNADGQDPSGRGSWFC